MCDNRFRIVAYTYIAGSGIQIPILEVCAKCTQVEECLSKDKDLLVPYVRNFPSHIAAAQWLVST